MVQKEKIKKALFESNPWWKQKLEINYKYSVQFSQLA